MVLYKLEDLAPTTKALIAVMRSKLIMSNQPEITRKLAPLKIT
jgi:hypothetical protein